MQVLDSITVNNKSSSTQVVIWLHGLGASGQDFVPMVKQLRFAKANQTKWIFPSAPNRSITLNQGARMPAWYDLLSLARTAKEDAAGIREMAKRLGELIEQEIKAGTPSEAIYLGGFSQGGAMALYLGLNLNHRLKGIIGLSCYLPLSAELLYARARQNQATPILLAHGQQDMVLPADFGQTAKRQLQDMGYQVIYKEYPMAHTVCPAEIQLLGQFLDEPSSI